jgi:hypothetical protein
MIPVEIDHNTIQKLKQAEVLDDMFERFPDLVEQAERNYGPDR